LQYRAAGLLFFLLVAAGAIVACSGGSSGADGSLPATRVSRGAASTPISHVIVIIQENRSFDDLFADFYGANGTSVGYAEPMPSPIASECAEYGQPVITYPTTVPLTEVDLEGNGFPNNWDHNQDLAHDYEGGYLTDCDSAAGQPTSSSPCAMDGFDLSDNGANGEGHVTCTYTYQYVNPSDIAPYWTMAQQYVLADNAFQTQGSESFTAHQALIAGGTAINSPPTASIIDDPSGFPWGCDGNPSGETTSLITIYGQYESGKGPFPCLTYPNGTIRDLLDANSVSWKFYADKVYSYQSGKADSPGIWSAFDAIKNVRYSKEWGTKVTFKDTKIFADIEHGRLPAVAWVTPDANNSDHPAEKSDTGPSWVAQVVNAIGTSKYWKSCAIVVLWDDWGGFYDHVPPPFYDNQGGLGFRFPMLIVSPYVQPHVEHTQYETTSVLRFIENNWGLGTLGQEDQRATSIANAFNFNQTPRPFATISAKYSRSFFLHQKPSGIPPDSE
jgi:phospholipase C